MPTNISNLQVVELTQKSINAKVGFADSLKPFSKQFDGSVAYGNGISVPVFTAGAADGTLDFNTDGSSTTVFTNVLLTSAAKGQVVIPAYQYAQLERYVETLTGGLVDKVQKTITDVAYAQFNVTNWPIASNKVVVSAWSESAPTLPALYSVVEAAKKTGKLDPTNIKVLMPSTTYGLMRGVLDALARPADLGFEVVPVYAPTLTQTALTDGSAVGIGIGADYGVSMVEEFEYFASSDNQIGYGLHIIPNGNGNSYTLAVRSIYGTKVLNTTGFLWASAS